MQHYRRVSYEQRCQIFAFVETKIGVREISRRLKVHRSTVYRELKRNRRVYDPLEAHQRYLDKKIDCRRARILELKPELLRRIKNGLKRSVSPERIAGRIGGISHQTIYNEIWNYQRPLAKYLPRFGKKRGVGRGKRKDREKKPDWYLNISDRPEHISKRTRRGHWERDTMYVKDRKMLLVCIERKSRYVRLEKVKEYKTISIGTQTMQMTTIKGVAPRTITNDNGNEFYGHSALPIPAYFCDPHSPYQRGSVEHIIGRIRKYLTRKTDINAITSKTLRRIEKILNDQPLKCLTYRTPYEVLFDKSVALAF